MTSVPKPLKFLRPHYGKLKEIYDNMAPGENKVKLLEASEEISVGMHEVHRGRLRELWSEHVCVLGPHLAILNGYFWLCI